MSPRINLISLALVLCLSVACGRTHEVEPQERIPENSLTVPQDQDVERQVDEVLQGGEGRISVSEKEDQVQRQQEQVQLHNDIQFRRCSGDQCLSQNHLPASTQSGRVILHRINLARRGGQIDSRSVRRSVLQQMPCLRVCYLQEMQKSDSQFGGQVQIGFTIRSNGQVGGPEILKSTIENSIFLQCMLSWIERWKFRHPSGGSKAVRLLFEFEPGR
jgi:hypothetical protein